MLAVTSSRLGVSYDQKVGQNTPTVTDEALSEKFLVVK